MNAENTKRCIIIGASHAAVQLITSLRQHGWSEEILVISDESHYPYQKPPLSKAYLSGDITATQLSLRAEAFYQRLNVAFLLGSRVTNIDRTAKTVLLENGEKISYHKLALCTGARARPLSIEGTLLAGVHYLRTKDDVTSIQTTLQHANKAVIIGGGYIGLETAASLKKSGLAVTVLETESRLLKRVASPQLSAFYQRLHKENGVEIRLNTSAKSLFGNDKIEKVLCSDGTNESTIDADIVIIGIGVLANIELAEISGLEVSNGIVVNEFAQTSDPNIVAAGDCTMHPNKVLGTTLRLESVPNATEQAKAAAANICGEQKEYAELPWFWSDQFDVKLQIVGMNQGYTDTVVRGDIENGKNFVLFYLKDGVLIAADCVNSPKEFMACRKLIPQKKIIEERHLQNLTVAIKTTS